MALIVSNTNPLAPPTDPLTGDVLVVDAGDPAEMETRIANAIASIPVNVSHRIGDIQIAGTGAGPQWEAWILWTNSTVAPTEVLQSAFPRVIAAVGGNPAEAITNLKNRFATLAPPPTAINKIVVSGGSAGRDYMALALVSGQQQPPPP